MVSRCPIKHKYKSIQRVYLFIMFNNVLSTVLRMFWEWSKIILSKIKLPVLPRRVTGDISDKYVGLNKSFNLNILDSLF
jgi:hypothetical protein